MSDVVKESTNEQIKSEEKIQEITENKISNNNKLQESIKEQIDENKKLEESVKETSSAYQDDGRESIYRKKKDEIQKLIDEIALLNKAEEKRVPKYVNDTYNDKRKKYKGLTDEELEAKISEKQEEKVSPKVHDLNVKWASIIALMDEVKERQDKILEPSDFANLSTDGFDELVMYYEKINTYLKNDVEADNGSVENLRNKTIELANVRRELENIIKTADPIDQLEYKLDNLINSLSEKKGKFSKDSADQILSTLNQYDKISGQNYRIEDITDNEKIIAGVNKRLHELQETQKRAEEAAKEEAAAMEQQKISEENTAQSIVYTTAKIEEQTQAIKENSDVIQQSNVGSKKVTANIPASITTGFKDEQGVVSNVVGSEITSLELLKNQIIEVREAIIKKTEEFELEGHVVSGVVERERDSIYYLITTLEELKATIEIISNLFENIDSDKLKDIKISGLTSLKTVEQNGNNSKESAKEQQELLKMQEKFIITKAKLDEAINGDKYTNNNYFVDKLKELQKAVNNINNEDLDQLKVAIKDINSLLSSTDEKNAKVGLVTKLTGLQKQVANSMASTKLSKSLRAQYASIAQTINDMLDGKIEYTSGEISRLRQELEKLDAQMISTGQKGKSFWDRVGAQITTFNTKIIAQYLSIHDLIRYTRQMFATIRELDTALVDLRKTTTMSAADMDKFYQESNKVAIQMGVTTEEMIQQAANWSRLGYSSKDAAAEMAALSSQFAQISPGMNLDTATDGLVSSMKAFGYEVDEVERKVMDNINRIGNTMATTNEEIVQMLTRSSAAMAAANNSIEETIALESAAVQVTRNAETTGTALRTISMRIRGYDEETEELSEDFENLSGKIADLTKTASKPGGISLFSDKDKTTYKSTYQLLKDISEIYDELTDKQQAELLEKLGGKRGGQVIAAILNDFSEVERAMKEMSEAAGSADNEMKIIQDSIDYKLNALKESWIGFLQDALKREDIKKLFDALIEGSKSLQESITIIIPVLTKFINGLSWLIETISKMNGYIKGFGLLTGLLYSIYKIKGKIADIRSLLSGLSKDFKVLDSSASKTSKTFSKSAVALNLYKVAIAAIIYSIYKFATVQKEINKEFNKAADEYKEGTKSLKDYKQRILELQGVLNSNNSTLEDQVNARQQLLEIQKDMIGEFGEEAGQVDVLTGSIEELNEGLDKLREKKFKEFLLETNDDSWHNWFDSWDNFIHNLNKLFRDAKNFQGPFYDSYDTRTKSQTIKDQIEHQYFNDDGTELTKKEFEILGYTTNKLNSLSKTKLGDFNAFDYYDDLLDLIDKYQEKPQTKEIEKALKWFQDEANRIRILLYDEEDGIADAYNTIFENSEIYPKYQDAINKINSAREQLKKALENEDYDFASKKASEISEILNGIFKDADPYTQRWIQNFISDIQGYLNENEFEVQLKISNSELNNKIKNLQDEINVAGQVNDLINKEDLITLASKEIPADKVGEYSLRYGAEVISIIQQIQEIAGEYDIPISVVVDKIDVPTYAVKQLKEKIRKEDIFGQYENLFSEEDLKILAEEIPGVMSMSINQMQRALADYREEAEKPFKSKSGMIDQLNELSAGFDKLDDIYADIYDKGGFDFAKLNTKQFKEAFGDLDVDYENFIETIADHTDDLDYCQDAFNSLVDSYIRSTGILDNVTEETAHLTQAMLEMYGVSNAEVIVQEALQATEAEAIVSKYNLAEATEADIQGLLSEIGAADGVKASLIAAQAAEVLFAGTNLNASQKVAALTDIARAAWGAAAALEVQESLQESSAANQLYGNQGETADQRSARVWEKIKAKYDERAQTAVTMPEYTGGEKTQSAIDKANKSGSESREILDWIEVALKRVQESVTRLGKLVSATYRNWSIRNNAIISEVAEVRREIELQTAAYQAYLTEAEKIPLAENYKKLVREGGMFSEEIHDKDLKKRIDEYKDLYEKAIQAKDAVEDLYAQIAQLARQKFDNIASEFEGKLSDIEHRMNYINNMISNVETRNKIAGKSFYKALIEQEKKNKSQLKDELSALTGALQEALSSGAIEYGSEEFNNMKKKIYEVEEAIQESKNKIDELKQKIKEVAKLDFDNLKQQFENALGLITGKVDFASSVVDAIEASGHIASVKFYQAMIDGANEQITANKKKLTTLQNRLAKAMSEGDIEKYDDQWYEMNDAIEEVKKSILDAANSVIQFANAMQQVQWDMFDRMQRGFSTLNDEAEYFIKMFSHEDIFDKESGALNDYGLATQALYVQRYQTYKEAAEEYAKEIQKLNEKLANDPSNVTLLDRYDELLHSFWDATEAAEEEKDTIKDLISNGFDKLRDSIMDIINRYKEALQAKKDLYDYENTIEEQTSNINSLQKQLLAYSGDDSEETRATIQKLSSDLVKAQKELEETEYDKYISDQEKLLDDFANSLEEWLNERLDDIDKLLSDAIAETNANAATISNTIIEEANANSGVITAEMRGIWAEEQGYMFTTNDILTSTSATCEDISNKIDLLPTSELMSEYLADDNAPIVSNLTNISSVSASINSTITEVNSVISRIKSVVEEFSDGYSSVIDNLGSNVVRAINAKELSVSVTVNGNEVSTDTTGGDGPDYDPSGGKKIKSAVKYKITNLSGTYDTAAQANAMARSIIQNELDAYKKSINNLPIASDAKAGMINNKKAELQRKYQVVRAKKGALITSDAGNIFDILAKSIGEDHMVAAKEGERILTEEQNRNFEKLANNGFKPIDEDLQKQLIKLSSTFDSGRINNFVDKISKVDLPNVDQPVNNNNSVQTNVGDISINLPNVTNKQEFVSWLKNDGQIEKIIQSMTLSKMTGENSYNKLKY